MIVYIHGNNKVNEAGVAQVETLILVGTHHTGVSSASRAMAELRFRGGSYDIEIRLLRAVERRAIKLRDG